MIDLYLLVSKVLKKEPKSFTFFFYISLHSAGETTIEIFVYGAV